MSLSSALPGARELVDQGYQMREIARELGVAQWAVKFWAVCNDVTFHKRNYYTPDNREGKPASQRAPSTKKLERNALIVAMYQQGATLDEVGKYFGITRERVRQIARVAGVSSDQGGSHLRASVRRAERDRFLEENCQRNYGLPRAVVRQLQKDRVTHAFHAQRKNAEARGISWKLDFASWYAIWQESGKLHVRGRGKGKYVMSRFGDAGYYEIGNVCIQLGTINSSDGNPRGRKAKNTGVWQALPGRARSWLARVGKHNVGYFQSEAEAVEARAQFILGNPQISARSFRGYAIIKYKTKKGEGSRYQVMIGHRYIGMYKTPEAALAARRLALEGSV